MWLFTDYEQNPGTQTKKTVVIKTVETRDGEVQWFIQKLHDIMQNNKNNIIFIMESVRNITAVFTYTIKSEFEWFELCFPTGGEGIQEGEGERLW